MRIPFYLFLSLTITLFCGTASQAQTTTALKTPSVSFDPDRLPRSIFSGVQGPFHVQGIAVDLTHGYIYFSFTTELLKTDLQGNPIGSVVGMTGHLGCLTTNPADGRIYGSLEYKNDEIGQGILQSLDANNAQQKEQPSAFYVAIFDGSRITRLGMDAEKDGVMSTVYLGEVVEDYYGTTVNGGRKVEHRFGCSGIDGLSFGPAFGTETDGKSYLNVAYGIYGDTTRADNDYQVILCYDVTDWKPYEQVLSQKNPHRSGPATPLHKYFVRTGNTTYGIQNLAYDTDSRCWYAAVYRGQKRAFPNYSIFAIDGTQPAREEVLTGFDTPTRGEVLTLAPAGLVDETSGIRGWHFDGGTTGLCPIGNGYWYISHPDNGPDGKHHSCTARLYRRTNDPQQLFKLVE